MLKLDHKYTDFDGNEQVETLYFNLTRSELVLEEKIEEMEDKIRAVQALSLGPDRILTPNEIRMIFRMVVFVMELSYGVRSEDGRYFSKEGLWEPFKTTSVYDSFVFSLFEDTAKATEFIYGVLPKELVDDALEEAKKMQQPDLFEKEQLVNDRNVVVGEVTSSALQDNRPAYIREDREPTQKELSAMTQNELLVAFARKSQQ